MWLDARPHPTAQYRYGMGLPPRGTPFAPRAQPSAPHAAPARSAQQQTSGGPSICAKPSTRPHRSLPAGHSLRGWPRIRPSAHPPSSLVMNTPSVVVHIIVAMPVPPRNTSAYGTSKCAPSKPPHRHWPAPPPPSTSTPQHLHMQACRATALITAHHVPAHVAYPDGFPGNLQTPYMQAGTGECPRWVSEATSSQPPSLQHVNAS